MPKYRPNIGDETGRIIELDHGWLEYRYGPGGTCEIVNIEVDGLYRGQGTGRQLLNQLVDLCKAGNRAKKIYAITRVENRIAQTFYDRVGFRVVGMLSGFYSDGTAVMYGRDV